MKAKVLHNVSHDGQTYSRGDSFEGPKEVVEALIAAGAVRDPNAPKEDTVDQDADAEEVLARANEQATQILEDAKAEAEKVKAEAQKEADQTVSDAKAEAEKVKAAAKTTAK